jgi:hypothetical protein
VQFVYQDRGQTNKMISFFQSAGYPAPANQTISPTFALEVRPDVCQVRLGKRNRFLNKKADLSGSVADPGCLSRIPDPDFYPSRIPNLGSRIQKQQ